MNYKRAIRETLLLFPSVLEVVPTPPGSHKRAHSPSLTKAWALADELANRQSEWHYIAVWSIGCALHRLIQEGAEVGATFVEKRNVNRTYIEHKFSESLLTSNTWFPRHIKRAYRRDRMLRGIAPFLERSMTPSPPKNLSKI